MKITQLDCLLTSYLDDRNINGKEERRKGGKEERWEGRRVEKKDIYTSNRLNISCKTPT